MSGQNVSGYIANEATAVTTSDTANNTYSYLYVGTGGSVSLVTEAGQTVTFSNVPDGGYVWVRTIRVRATGTTASNIVGMS
jgi:hypothetical protein